MSAQCHSGMVADGFQSGHTVISWHGDYRGTISPTRAPRGDRDTLAYFPEVVVLNRFPKKVCVEWVDGTMMWGCRVDELLERVTEVLWYSVGRGLYSAAHKTFFRCWILWCGKVPFMVDVRHDPDLAQGLTDLRQPRTVGRLQDI